jgi:hypothetical protein
MQRLALLIPVCGIVIGCMDETIAPAPPSPPPLPTFVITGTVLDEAGAPVSAAVAELVGLNNGTATDESGQFRLTGARGATTVRVRKEGFAPHLHNLFVAADQTINVTLRRAFLSDSIVLGATITGVTDWPPCDPIRWDAQAPCRRFVFTAPASGILVISISWDGGPPLDALIYEGSHTLLAYSTDAGFDNATVNAPVVAGHGYEIRVNSYYNSQIFNLRADLSP